MRRLADIYCLLARFPAGILGSRLSLSQLSEFWGPPQYTTAGAYATGEEQAKGLLAPGFLADFVVLDSDPLEVDANRISSITVRETYVGGECVFRIKE